MAKELENEAGGAGAPDAGTPTTPTEKDQPKATVGDPEDRIAAKKAREEAEYWRGVAEGQRNAGAPPPEPTPVVKTPEPPPEPKFEDFATVGEFENARTKWLRLVSKDDAVKEVETKTAEERERDRRARVVEGFNSQLSEASKLDPEVFTYRDRVGTRVAPHTAQLIMESEVSARVLRYLHDNPHEIGRLNTLDPVKAAKAMGKIEADLVKEAGKSSTEVKTVSDAPPPPPTVNSGSPAPVDTDPSNPESDKLNADDWVAKRNQQILAKMRR